MKAEIDKHGVLHVVPENETEAYALKKWRADAEIAVSFSTPGAATMSYEQHWRADALDFNANWPRQIGDYQ